MDGAIPFNYHRLVEWPVFEAKCLPCHKKENKGLTDMSYASVAKYRLAFGFQGEEGYTWKGTGGSRTTPGRFGAYASGIWKSLTTKPAMKDVIKGLTKDELRRLTLWLEMNSNRLCWESDDKASLDAQRRGDVVWPPIDMQSYNPTGIEYLSTDNDAPGSVKNVKMDKYSSPVNFIRLNWQPAVDDASGVGAYRIYRDNTLLCTVPDLVYVDRSAGTATHTYTVSAVDRTGKEGPKTGVNSTHIVEGSPQLFPDATIYPQTFSVRTFARNNAIVVNIRVPGESNDPAIIKLFSLNGRLASQIIAKRNNAGLYTAEFQRTGSISMYLCSVKVGIYKEMQCVINVK
jgi:hypothetical protein